MTTEETPILDLDPSSDGLLVVQLQRISTMGDVALNNLQTAIDEGQRVLAEMQTRVDLGQMGAEYIPTLETAIAEAKQVQSEMETQVADVQAQQEEIIASAQEQPNAT